MDCKIIDKQRDLLTRCFDMLIKSNVCPDSSREDMFKAMCFSHVKGFLYTNSGLNAFVCGYRIPEVSEKWKSTIPDKEEGEIFFVNFAVSEEPNKWILLKMLRQCLKDNPSIKELCYYRRNSDKDFKRIHIRRNSNG